MTKCKLCNINDANKKGSHIVPHFLLKRIENIEGRTERDYELGFTIEKYKVSSHFGRSVQPEKLDDIYGELSDEDIEKNQHPLVVDNIFCSECEMRFSIVENEYSKTINNTGTEEYESGTDCAVGILFWGSILWRMSINGKSGVKLKSEENELLRGILNQFLPHDIEKLDRKAMNENKLIKLISYKLLRCSDCKKDDLKWLLFHPEFNTPLCLFIDEFILAFDLNGKFDDIETVDCFGANELLIKATTNKIDAQEKIEPYDSSVFKSITKKLSEKAKEEFASGIDETLNCIHVAAGGEGDIMPAEISEEIISELSSEEKKLGRKYTQNELVNVSIRVMKKYAP